MIEVKNLTKRFGSTVAVSKLSCAIPDGCVFGLVGSNGAGKSTLIRMLAGVYRPDEGSVALNGAELCESPAARGKIAYVSDELYFLPGASIERMAKLYKASRENYDEKRLFELAELLGLNKRQPVAQFSKGMKRQAAIILALACKPSLLLLDETFDGLDPVMRAAMKRILVEDVLDRNASALISSHSLRELEDSCDRLALLHKGGMVLESEVSELKTNMFKLQIALKGDFDRETIAEASGCELLDYRRQGSVASVILRGQREKAQKGLSALNPLILDILPLSLEEIFIYETESLGYTIAMAEGGKNDA